jgi:predicted  nucleic acid-binding Zn-ribbon protein
VNSTIQALMELQCVDDAVLVHSRQRDELAANLQRLSQIVQRIGSELEDKREKLKDATRFYESKQVELKGDADRVSRAKVKLGAVTRTKEYAAMQRELDQLRRKYDEDEAELKQLATAIDEYQVAIASEETKLGELTEEASREQLGSAERLAELDAQIVIVSKDRAKIETRLDPQIVKRYRRILGQREGRAVVPAIDGKCSGCQRRLPPQTYILVQRGETVENCRNCHRYLYFVPAAVPAAQADDQVSG